jgi:Alpha-galactosidases/6-phospho-beta-glucosidases, family 4 of glycosyl hydrolases
MEGDYRKALEALIANPLIRDFDKAKACLDELLIGHKAYLPNFNAAIRKIEAGTPAY